MRNPGFGETNLGAVAGAVAGSFGGLLAVGLPPAILDRNVTRLFHTPVLTFIAWLVCLGLGWVIGGQIGPRLGERFQSARVEYIAGALGGLVPVVLIVLWSWYMSVPH